VVDVHGVLGLDQLRDRIGKGAVATVGIQQRPYLSLRIEDNLGGPRLVLLGDAARLLHGLESVAKRTVTEVVQQRRDHRDFGPCRIELLPEFASDDLDQRSRDVKHAERVGEARMRGAGKDELGNAELLDAAQPLELRRADQAPGEPGERVAGAEHDQPMHGVAHALGALGGGDGFPLRRFGLGRHGPAQWRAGDA
jgi:hypothetical protein